MGAHGHETLLKDPAIEEWVWMRNNTHRYFKFTRRTAPALVTFGLVVPALTFYFASATQDKVDLKPMVKKSWAEAYAEKKSE
ncbi:hypothetical protein DL89DRAFT_321213 [Linderina pennispora]|uniref:NADH dehydrogenase [ubiquinone] 1 beta subcomplex subunit 4 n=1 Tax=Linderina pennispora TaxID=61395 RepID=A0A1Y1WEZ7_9FUNG|nr:uncharacterized protein DL89DRAFT_321213 [Linderina pennispora]KAJ1957249.1 hypothetical protein EC988_000925 [Linderina pennispora]ORX72097.1 hypothetical protein DL89DRAFT_321213 [Linderina pennispora]